MSISIYMLSEGIFLNSFTEEFWKIWVHQHQASALRIPALRAPARPGLGRSFGQLPGPPGWLLIPFRGADALRKRVCVCVCVRVCVCVYVYIHIHMYDYIQIYTYTHTCIGMYIHTYICVFTYIDVYTHICMYTWLCAVLSARAPSPPLPQWYHPTSSSSTTTTTTTTGGRGWFF